MRFVTYRHRNKEYIGVLSADSTKVHSLRKWGDSMLELIDNDSPELRRSIQETLANTNDCVPLDSVTLEAPIPYPKHDILCIGLNYAEHRDESSRFGLKEHKITEYPTIFSKRVNRAVAYGKSITAHQDMTDQLDYEAELAVIIGKRCDHVDEQNVAKHIFGYTIVNDITARDIQRSYGQYAFGKGLDGFTPMGPWIVTTDELKDPANLQVQSRVNGEVRQNGNTKDLIFSIPFLISTLSRGIVLEPGDILITGTPAGVGAAFDPPRFLRPGDVVECEVEQIGILRNQVG